MNKLVCTDTARAQTFRHNVKETVKEANSLIDVFERFQEFKKIDTLDVFENLIENQVGFFDDTLIAQVSANFVKGRARIDPAPLAEMLSIDRDGYLEAVEKVKITEPQYFLHKNFMTFTTGRFEVNPDAIEREVEKFDTYATTEKEMKIVSVVENLVTALKEYDIISPLSFSAKTALKSVLNLHLSAGTSGELIVNPEHIKKLLGK